MKLLDLIIWIWFFILGGAVWHYLTVMPKPKPITINIKNVDGVLQFTTSDNRGNIELDSGIAGSGSWDSTRTIWYEKVWPIVHTVYDTVINIYSRDTCGPLKLGKRTFVFDSAMKIDNVRLEDLDILNYRISDAEDPAEKIVVDTIPKHSFILHRKVGTYPGIVNNDDMLMGMDSCPHWDTLRHKFYNPTGEIINYQPLPPLDSSRYHILNIEDTMRILIFESKLNRVFIYALYIEN